MPIETNSEKCLHQTKLPDNRSGIQVSISFSYTECASEPLSDTSTTSTSAVQTAFKVLSAEGHGEAARALSWLHTSKHADQNAGSDDALFDKPEYKRIISIVKSHHRAEQAITMMKEERILIPPNKSVKLNYNKRKKILLPRSPLLAVFKKMVRLVIYQLNILNLLYQRYANGFAEMRMMREFLNSQKNMRLFYKDFYRRRAHVSLPRNITCIMRKEPAERSEAETQKLQNFMGQLNMSTLALLVEGRSQAVKQELARILRFQRIPSERIIVKQGHKASCLYILLRGEVVVFFTSNDPVKGDVSNLVSIEKEGFDFGAGADWFPSSRPHTVISKEVIDLLWIEKEDFYVLLDILVSKDRESCKSFLSDVLLPIATHDENSFQYCINHSFYLQYPADTEIPIDQLMDTHGNSKFVFFVYSGACYQLRLMQLVSKATKYKNKIVRLKSIHQCTSERDRNRFQLPKIGRKNIDHLTNSPDLTSLSPDLYLSTTDRAEKKSLADVGLCPKASGTVCQGNELERAEKIDNLQISVPKELKKKAKKRWKHAKSEHVVAKLVQVLSPGKYFGVGEVLDNTIFRTSPQKPTEFIVIPRYVFDSRVSLFQQLNVFADQLNYSRPSTADVYSDHIEQLKWNQYKTRVVNETILPHINKNSYDRNSRMSTTKRVTKYMPVSFGQGQFKDNNS